MASHWDVPFWWSCCTINMMKLGHKHPWKRDAIHCDSQLFERRLNFQSFAGIALWQWGDALNAPLPVQGERIGSRKNMVKFVLKKDIKVRWNLVTSVHESGRLVLQLHSASTSSRFHGLIDLPRTKTQSFVRVSAGGKDPGAWLEQRSTFGLPGLPCLLVAVNWKPGNEPNLFYLKSWKFQITDQEVTLAKERQNLVLQIFDENVLRQEPKGTRFHIREASPPRHQISRDSACVTWVTNIIPFIELQSRQIKSTKNLGNYLLS